MEERNIPDSNSKLPKRGTLFLIAILIGLLFGTVITLLVLNVVGLRHHDTIQVIPMDTSTAKNASDTIVKYVIHKYESDSYRDRDFSKSDSLLADSVYGFDETEDLTLDDKDVYLIDEYADNNVVEEKLIEKLSAKVVCLDANKVECTCAENVPTQLQLQVWESHIKNKLTYHFYGNLLKVKGLKPEHCKVVYFKNNYYLVNNHHVYPIHHNSQFERLVETHEVGF